MKDSEIIGIIGELKTAALNGVMHKASEINNSCANPKYTALDMAALFAEDILLMPAKKYLDRPEEND